MENKQDFHHQALLHTALGNHKAALEAIQQSHSQNDALHA
jgi:hypothetical protein